MMTCTWLWLFTEHSHAWFLLTDTKLCTSWVRTALILSTLHQQAHWGGDSILKSQFHFSKPSTLFYFSNLARTKVGYSGCVPSSIMWSAWSTGCLLTQSSVLADTAYCGSLTHGEAASVSRPLAALRSVPDLAWVEHFQVWHRVLFRIRGLTQRSQQLCEADSAHF